MALIRRIQLIVYSIIFNHKELFLGSVIFPLLMKERVSVAPGQHSLVESPESRSRSKLSFLVRCLNHLGILSRQGFNDDTWCFEQKR